MRKPFYLNSLLLGVLLLLSNTIRADSIQKIVVNNPACDSIFLSNGKVIAVKNLEITSKELSFSYCKDTTDQRHRAPLQQIQKIKKRTVVGWTATTNLLKRQRQGNPRRTWTRFPLK